MIFRFQLFIAVFLLPVIATAQSSILNHELARTTDNDVVSIDFHSSLNKHLRYGMDQAEIFVRYYTANSQVAGYKTTINQNLSAYGGIGIDTPTNGSATTVLLAGAAYTHRNDQMLLNANPELFHDGTDANMYLKLAGYYRLTENESASNGVMAGLAVNAQLSNCNADCNQSMIGVSWQLKQNILLEAAVYNSYSGLELPGVVRLNILF